MTKGLQTSEPTGTEVILLLLDGAPPSHVMGATVRQLGSSKVTVLSLGGPSGDLSLPATWKQLPVQQLLDVDALRRDFLDFLESWPSQPLLRGRSFDQLFRSSEDYSLWWIGPGSARHPDRQPFTSLRTVWLFDRAFDLTSPDRVFVFTEDGRLARAVASRCARSEREAIDLPGSAPPSAEPWRGQWLWLAETLARLLLSPLKAVLRALFARFFARPVEGAGARCNEPSLVFTASLPHDVHQDADGWSIPFWRELVAAVGAADPTLRMRYLLRTQPGFASKRRLIGRFFPTGWRTIRRLDGAMPIQERYPVLGSWARAVPGNVAILCRHARLERSSIFRSSFTFAGADVSSFYIPELRRHIRNLPGWEREVASITMVLQAEKNVRTMIITNEMYRWGMTNIAAARRLGIPTIGYQHGTIFPMHLIYTLPQGQIEGAPVPDYFAAYGSFAKEVVSEHGAFPPERVWIAGSPRFDQLVNSPADTVAARSSLGLSPEKKIILVATQHYHWFPEAVRSVLAAVRERQDCVTCIKTHPIDVPLAEYRDLAEQVGVHDVLFFDDRFDELLSACDVLVSGSSTTLLEAILLGKKAICINMSWEPDRYPYAADGGALGARSPAEVSAALEKVLSDIAPASETGEEQERLAKARRRFLDRHAGPSADGEGAATLARRICDLVQRSDNSST